MLKSDLIQHKLVPVSGYNDLDKANAALVATDPDVSLSLFYFSWIAAT